MRQLAQRINDGSVSKQAFVNVRASYVSDLEKEQKLERPNLERISDLKMSIQFCDNFLRSVCESK